MKQWICGCWRFESSVNSEGIETEDVPHDAPPKFESSVNSEGIETSRMAEDWSYVKI